MNNTIDIIVLVSLAYFFFQGFRKGLLRILLGPLTFIIGIVIAGLYYYKTRNFFFAIGITVAAPFILYFIFSLGITIWEKVTKNEDDIPPANRLIASALNTIWNGGYLAVLLVTLMMVPTFSSWFGAIQKGIATSRSYHIVRIISGKHVPIYSLDITTRNTTIQNSQALEKLRSSPKTAEALKNTRIKTFLEDPEIKELLTQRKFIDVAKNKKTHAILADKEAMKKLLAIQQELATVQK